LLELLAAIRLSSGLPAPDLEAALSGTDLAPPEGASLSGWLYKSDAALGDFKRRFMSLDPILGRAQYYKDEGQENLKGELRLEGCIAVAGPPSRLRVQLPTPYVITVASGGRITALCLDSIGEMLTWLSVLQAI